MSLVVLVINKDRYLINEESKASEKLCEDIMGRYPVDASVSFDKVRKIDYRKCKKVQFKNKNL